jgi:flagellar hook-basal body complex protein FliE
MPTIPIAFTRGPEWQIGGVGGAGGDVAIDAAPGAQPAEAGGKSFGSFLSKQVQALDGMQDDAAKQSMSVADGTAEDPTAAVMSIERAKLAMQLASQIRTKSVEAINDVFHTTV